MQRIRNLLAIAALTAGIAVLSTAKAADVGNDEFKILIDQDSKLINKALAAVAKASEREKKVKEQQASSGIHSTALYIASYANARITGSDAANDAKMATLRDSALKIAKAAHDKDFKAITEAASGITADPKPAAGAKATKIDIFKESGLKEGDFEVTMHAFKKPVAFGTGAEDEIKANAKKAVAKSDNAAAIAQRVLVLAELSKHVKKGENAKEKQEWDDLNIKMEKAAQDLLAAAKAKKPAADLQKAFSAINGSCTACHNVFK
jgi:hypothetical protein